MGDGVPRRLAGSDRADLRRSLLFLVLSGLATGASWLCYFKALQIGDVNKVVPVDKSSSVLTILLALILLHEEISVCKAIGIVGIGIGTYLMIQPKSGQPPSAKAAAHGLYTRRCPHCLPV